MKRAGHAGGQLVGIREQDRQATTETSTSLKRTSLKSKNLCRRRTRTRFSSGSLPGKVGSDLFTLAPFREAGEKDTSPRRR